MTAPVAAALFGGAAAGAILTGLITLFNGVLTRRHEHRRWLLDRRLGAYASYNGALAAWQMLQLREPGEDTTDDALRDLVSRRAEVLLLAPHDTGLAAVETTQAAIQSYGLAQDDDEEASLAAMDRSKEHSLRLLGLQMRDIKGRRKGPGVRHLLSHLKFWR